MTRLWSLLLRLIRGDAPVTSRWADGSGRPPVWSPKRSLMAEWKRIGTKR